MGREYKLFCWGIVVWIALVFGVLLLTGCSKTVDPVSDINTGIQDDVAQLIDYAHNNMTMDADKQLLLNGARDCAARANALTKQHEVSIKACETKADKAKSERNMLALVLVLLVAVKLFNIRL